jgi:uncharacterized protein (DUF2236 family)
MVEPLQQLTMRAGIDLLPAWARRMNGLPTPTLGSQLIRASTLGIARTVRWAFK